MDLPALAIRTGALNNSILAGVSPAARAIVPRCGGQKFVPASFAKIIICFGNVFIAINANRRPEKLVQTL
jgi:hypothetical protein